MNPRVVKLMGRKCTGVVWLGDRKAEVLWDTGAQVCLVSTGWIWFSPGSPKGSCNPGSSTGGGGGGGEHREWYSRVPQEGNECHSPIS